MLYFEAGEIVLPNVLFQSGGSYLDWVRRSVNFIRYLEYFFRYYSWSWV